MMELTTEQKLRMYIDAELGDAALYRKLATIAPNNTDRQLLLEFAANEQMHAARFKNIYKKMTGISYDPVVPVPEITGSYKEILHDRILDESGDYRKYGEQYLITKRNTALKNAYYLARTDENVHALRLIYMLTE